MAFNLQNWSCVSGALNKPVISISGVNTGVNSICVYQSNVDAVATIEAANYFTQVATDVVVGDYIFVSGSDAQVILTVTAVNTAVVPATITTSAFSPTGSVGTSNITNLAVTAAKIANNTITNTQIANNTIGSTQLATSVLQVATGTLSAANVAAMYGAPVQAIAATVAGAGNAIVVRQVVLNYTYVSAAYAAGGNIVAQYDNTVHGAGINACAAVSATGFTDQTHSTVISAAGQLPVSAVTGIANKGIYFSNLSAAFTTGDGTIEYTIYYEVLPVA